MLQVDRGHIIKSQPQPKRRVGPAAEADDDVVEVLLVEDDQSVLEMYRLKLELDGYRVSTATDGEEGLRKAETLRPDIIFLGRVRGPAPAARPGNDQGNTGYHPFELWGGRPGCPRFAAWRARVPDQGPHHAQQSVGGN